MTVTENDTAGLVISKDNLTVGEGDAAGMTYTVALATQPSDSVTVSITGHSGTDLDAEQRDDADLHHGDLEHRPDRDGEGGRRTTTGLRTLWRR